ncbi:MAG: acyloxyacyl hydrolase [Flavobacteriales bacterium]|nr:acyloxyacyl hydrolase [Flavobacteriales bacterium]
MRPALLPILILAATACAQQPWSIGARGHYGFLWAHRPASWILVEGHAGAGEVFIERRVEGDREWHRTYGLPRYGVLAIHTRMANPQRIGDAMSLMPYLTFPLMHGERLSLGLRVGWGVGYVSKPFDRRENTRQIAIGSRINGAMQLMPELRYEAQRIAVQLGLSIDHWSNGSAKQPNLGLNFLSLSLGASYALGQAPPQRSAPERIGFERERREYHVVAAFGVSESGRPLNGQYSVYALSADASWRVGGKGALGGGIDLFNKGDLATVLPGLEGKSRAALTQAGAHAGGSLLLGRGELLFQFGGYLYSPAPDDAPVYQRTGMRYRLGKRLLASVCLKTHFATADHWEFGIGYRWN